MPFPTIRAFVFAPVLLLAIQAPASARDLIVLCAGAAKAAVFELAPRWSGPQGARATVAYYTAGELRAKLAAGEAADVVIMPKEALDEEVARIEPGSRRDLVAVDIGVAVAAGAPRPDLSTEEGVRRALLAARSVTYVDPTRGTSGRFFDEVVLKRLGIQEQVRAKAVLGSGGMTAEKIAAGQADLAVQQMTELLPVPGVQVIGPLPASLQKTTVYTGGVLRASAMKADAQGFVEFLLTPASRAVFDAKGYALP